MINLLKYLLLSVSILFNVWDYYKYKNNNFDTKKDFNCPKNYENELKKENFCIIDEKGINLLIESNIKEKIENIKKTIKYDVIDRLKSSIKQEIKEQFFFELFLLLIIILLTILILIFFYKSYYTNSSQNSYQKTSLEKSDLEKNSFKK